MVCMANICRSPMAHAILRNLVKEQGLSDKIQIESAGTHVPIRGLLPDKRTLNVLNRRGINSKGLKTRQLKAVDGAKYNYILVMDNSNMAIALKIIDEGCQNIKYILDYATHINTLDVPDPYYGHPDQFEEVYNILEPACRGVLKKINQIDSNLG